MTSEQLAKLPLGARVRLEGEGFEIGTVVKVGPVVNIEWPNSGVTNYVDTNSPKWETFIKWLDKVEGE
jgi:hypothetical protein